MCSKADSRASYDEGMQASNATSLEQYPIPRLEDLCSTLSGGKKFSKLDLSHAYQQVVVDEESQKFLTINTQRGLFTYQLLPFGVASAPAIFQRIMERLVQGIPKVEKLAPPNNYDELCKALLSEYTLYQNPSASRLSAFRIKQGRHEFPKEYYEHLRKMYFAGRDDPSAEEDVMFKSSFVSNLYPTVRKPLTLLVDVDRMSAGELRQIAVRAWDSERLEKRGERRAEAEKRLAQAQEAGEQENIDKFSKRLVKVTKQHNEEYKRLLTLIGVPYIEAPCEAEASCAALVKSGKIYATATEDMDGLTFGTSVLLRHLTASEAKKLPIEEFHFSCILQEMGLTHQQFIDLCILLGCDYCGTIKGIGPKRAIDLIK
ncbi:flap endonuclease 1 [Labeo rohita]|uniref:ribonuclease H n=1 Tax=Labeo rohita TaxID=84645 RepID=A0A498ML59_LABRO|nr:flap endonuclease 1 [Labeo rohita]RXN28242.1 flap endonuclease 1 [Labeo rohita]